MLLMLSTFDIVLFAVAGALLLTTLVVGIVTLIEKKRNVSNKNPKKGGN